MTWPFDSKLCDNVAVTSSPGLARPASTGRVSVALSSPPSAICAAELPDVALAVVAFCCDALAPSPASTEVRESARARLYTAASCAAATPLSATAIPTKSVANFICVNSFFVHLP
jgi:hypothetical protein